MDLLQYTDHGCAPFRGGGGGVVGAAMLGLLDREPLAGLELSESPPLPLPNARTLLAAECGRSCCEEGAALHGQHKTNLSYQGDGRDRAAGTATQLCGSKLWLIHWRKAIAGTSALGKAVPRTTLYCRMCQHADGRCAVG